MKRKDRPELTQKRLSLFFSAFNTFPTECWARVSELLISSTADKINAKAQEVSRQVPQDMKNIGFLYH